MVGLPGDLVQFPAPMRQLTTIYNSSPRGSDVLFWHGTQTCIKTNHPYTLKKIIKVKFFFKKKDLQIITIKGTSQSNSFSYKVTHYKERKGLVVARHNSSTRRLQQGGLESMGLLI